MKTDVAVSDVLGTMILVSILVILAGVVTAFVVAEVSNDAEYIPIVSFQQSASSYHLYHAGGDSLKKSEIRIFYRNDDITEQTTINNSPWEFWKTGEMLYLGNNNVEFVTIVGRTSAGTDVLLFEGTRNKKVSG